MEKMDSSVSLEETTSTISSTANNDADNLTTLKMSELLSSNVESLNDTNLTAIENADRGTTLQDWEVVLIASLSAGGIVIVAIFIIMWKYFTRKPVITIHTRNVTPGPASTIIEDNSRDSKVRCGCFPRVNKGTSTTNGTNRGEMAQSSSGQSDEKEQYPGQQTVKVLDVRLPLPPIGDSSPFTDSNGLGAQNDALAVGRAHMYPRRLAPLNEHTKITATNLAGGTVLHRAGAFGPVQQNMDLRPFSRTQISIDQRRPIPTPPMD